VKLRVSSRKSEGDFLRFPQSSSAARAKPFLSAGFRGTFPQGLWISSKLLHQPFEHAGELRIVLHLLVDLFD
jgi:hypothetical protein